MICTRPSGSQDQMAVHFAPGDWTCNTQCREPHFFVAMFHQLHCLRLFQAALTGQNDQGHAHHCLNYIRQWSLCQADLTLEAGDFTTQDFKRSKVNC
jgi:hypothetical protein